MKKLLAIVMVLVMSTVLSVSLADETQQLADQLLDQLKNLNVNELVIIDKEGNATMFTNDGPSAVEVEHVGNTLTFKKLKDLPVPTVDTEVIEGIETPTATDETETPPRDFVPSTSENNPLIGVWVCEAVSVYGQLIEVATDEESAYVMTIEKESVKYQVGLAEPLFLIPTFGENGLIISDETGASQELYLKEDKLCMDTDANGYPMTMIFKKIK